MLTTWLYLSVSSLPDGTEPDIVDELRAVSRRRNADLDVTGALIFAGSHFAQMIEGPAPNVALLRAAIARDARHRDVLTLHEGPVDGRRFADWSLAYTGPSIFVERELRRLRREASRPTADTVRSLTRLLTEFARAGGVGDDRIARAEAARG